ncbi:hypothetical protein N7523_001309 [Penicillium sp. IBT 18751x]|nr:hypothetical protein N7523_001309 [Penicillium sp. IBT 18751x]
MVRRVVHHEDPGHRRHEGPTPKARKLTLSCSRCRASKLKCDRNEPCNECTKRAVGHMCTKDERQPRAKRTKTSHNNNTHATEATEAEHNAELLESFVEGAPQTKAYEPSSSTGFVSRAMVAADYLNPKWTHIGYSQKVKLMRDVVDVLPAGNVIRALHETFITRCQAPLGNIFHTTAFKQQAQSLYDCFIQASPEARAVALATKFTTDEIACLLMALVLGLAFYFSTGLRDEATERMTTSVAAIRASDSPHLWRQLSFRCVQGRVSIYCGSIASLQAAVMFLLDGHEDFLELDALLVTAISGARKLQLHRLGDADLNLTATLPDVRPGNGSSFALSTVIRTEIGVRICESRWALVARDWSRGQALGYYNILPSTFNTRIPLHINDDQLCPTDAGSQDRITERPRSEFTMLSYTICTLEMVFLMRESLDLRDAFHKFSSKSPNEKAKIRQNLTEKYEKYCTGLPSFFQLESSEGINACGPLAAMPVHRWMLHQQLWGMFLRLHRDNLSSPESRATCRLLAKSIIDCGGQIRTRCTVCGSLSVGDAQLLNAASIFIIDLLHLSRIDTAKDSNARMNQLMGRSSVAKALDLFQEKQEATIYPQENAFRWKSAQDPQLQRVRASTYRCITALKALSDLEKEESEKFNRNYDRSGLDEPAGRKRTSSLSEKIKTILENLPRVVEDEYSANESFAGDLGAFPTLGNVPTAAEDPDLDVLPMLTNDPSGNLWELFDSPSFSHPPIMDGIFPAPVDWQSIIDSMPDEPSSE